MQCSVLQYDVMYYNVLCGGGVAMVCGAKGMWGQMQVEPVVCGANGGWGQWYVGPIAGGTNGGWGQWQVGSMEGGANGGWGQMASVRECRMYKNV